MNIYFDLDGTLIDSKERLYKLFQQLVPQSDLTFDSYWEFKKNKIGHPSILKNEFKFSDSDIEKFKASWLLLIEKKEWLAYDHPFDGVTDFLKKLHQEQHRLYIITARQFPQRAFDQVKSFGWKELFHKVLVTGGGKEKIVLLEEENNLKPGDWLIGDTGKDIQTGKQAGINTCAVLTGFLSKEKLEEYHPDKIIDSVIEFDTDKIAL